MADARQNIVDWARWGVDNRANFIYTQGPTRMQDLDGPNPPITCDCSSFATYTYRWGGAPDPNGLGYNGYGYTGTLLDHGTHIAKADAIPGDLVVYGAYPGEHVAIIVEAGPDPLTVSHGQQGDPNYCRVSQDGRMPQTYLRFDTTNINNGKSPFGPAPTPQPKESDMAVSPVITNFKPGLQHVVQVSGGVLYHKWRGTDGKWTNEILAGPNGGAAKITTKFVGQPQVTVAGNQMVITVENDGGAVFYFAQGVNGSTWGAVQLP